MEDLNEKKSIHVDYRHLAFFFIGAVVICAVFFALGFVVGRSQAFDSALKGADHEKAATASAPIPIAQGSDEDSVRVAGTQSEEIRSSNSAADYRKDLDFYDAVKDRKIDPNFHPETSQKNNVVARVAPETKKTQPVGTVLSLQVAALRSPKEAAKLVKTLKSKGYPVFTVNPAKSDSLRLVRVQVGPYSNEEEAMKAKNRLSEQGFSSILKR